MKSYKVVPIVALVGIGWTMSAFGATQVPCPNATATDTTRQYFVTPNNDGSGAPVCYLSGTGNLAAGNGDDAILAANPMYKFLDKQPGVGGLADGALFTTQDSTSPTPAPGSVTGRFWVDASKLTGFTNFIIAFTAGDGGVDPRWVSYKFFNLAECTLANPCDWATAPDKAGSLSHATIYGEANVVPIPAAAWLLLSGLGGLGLLGRRRKAA